MGGGDGGIDELFSYVDLDDRVRRDHPLRATRQIVNDAPVFLEREFTALYAPIGRPSIAPERLLMARLQAAATSAGCEEIDEVSGDGHAALRDDGSMQITFAYHNRDEAILKAKHETSSTAC